MPRPRGPRRIGFVPGCTYFKPAGVPLRALKETVLTLEETEALRLADAEGKYQEEAAEAMGVSRPTFSRIIASARGKVATALIHGQAIRVETEAGTGVPPAGPGRGRGHGGGGRGRRGRGWQT